VKPFTLGIIAGSMIAVAAVLLPTGSARVEGLVVHEWGTFTCLQDEDGRAIGGINTDDEPVPRFVHNLAATLLIPPPDTPKGVGRCHPDVTMRLETPVLYFHLPEFQTEPLTVSVDVEFHGGWLTQFYPVADAVAPGVEPEGRFGHLRSDTVGRLAWPALAVGTNAKGPDTTERVWTSPRAVQAASVTTADNESEKFLFYRGVGHINAPLRVVRDPIHDQLSLYSQSASTFPSESPLVVRNLWLTEIHPDGSSAFRRLAPVTLTGNSDELLATTSASFPADEFSPQNAARFRAEMHQALVGEGLLDDEADALLNTWELSYFKSAGARLFFIVPRAWTDRYLPLRVSVPARTERVMMGRVELITPAQRRLLAKIATDPAPDLQSAGGAAPQVYQEYLDLGRFRNALILDEESRRPTAALHDFIDKNALGGYDVSSR